MAQWIRCLSHRHEALSLSPQNPVKSPTWQRVSVAPGLLQGDGRQENLCSLEPTTLTCAMVNRLCFKKKKKEGRIAHPGLSSDLILKCARTNTHAQNVFNDELICAVSQRKDISNSIFQLALKAHAYNLSYPQKDYKFEVCLDHIANSRPVWAHTFNPSA